jgi:hypothetical protein
VQLWTPDRVSDEEKALLEELASKQSTLPATRSKGFWTKMKEVLGA